MVSGGMAYAYSATIVPQDATSGKTLVSYIKLGKTEAYIIVKDDHMQGASD